VWLNAEKRSICYKYAECQKHPGNLATTNTPELAKSAQLPSAAPATARTDPIHNLRKEVLRGSVGGGSGVSTPDASTTVPGGHKRVPSWGWSTPLLAGSGSTIDKSVLGMSPLLRCPCCDPAGEIPLDELLGISFEMFAEKMRDDVYAQIVLVRKRETYRLSHWLRWSVLILMTFAVWGMAYLMVGTISAMVALLWWFACGIYNYLQNDKNLPGYMVMCGCFAVPWCCCAVLLHFKEYEYILLVSTTCTVLITGILYTILAKRPAYRALFPDAEQTSLAQDVRLQLPLPPGITWPVVVRFHPQDFPAMFRLRAALVAEPKTRAYVAEVWVGNQWAEGFLTLIPSPFYNSRRLRWVLHVVLDFVVPFYLVAQGLGQILPGVFYAFNMALRRVNTDFGYIALVQIFRLLEQVTRLFLFVLTTVLGRLLRAVVSTSTLDHMHFLFHVVTDMVHAPSRM
jgi:hypothetical protein